MQQPVFGLMTTSCVTWLSQGLMTGMHQHGKQLPDWAPTTCAGAPGRLDRAKDMQGSAPRAEAVWGLKLVTRSGFI